MGRPARSRVGARVDGRAHERVVELHAAGRQAHEAGRLGDGERIGWRPRTGEHREVAVVAGGRDEERVARSRGQRVHAPAERLGEALGQRRRADGRDVVVPRRELEQRERVAGGRRVQAVDAGRRRAPRQQRARGCAVEPAEREDGQIAAVEQRRLARPHGEHHGDGIGEQPPQREPQRVGARVVEPVRVVDEHERGRDLRLRGEQAQRRRADGEPVAAAARPERQRARRGPPPAAAGSARARRAPGAAARAGRRTAPPPRTPRLARAARASPPRVRRPHRAGRSCRCRPPRPGPGRRSCLPGRPRRGGRADAARSRGPAAPRESRTRWGT